MSSLYNRFQVVAERMHKIEPAAFYGPVDKAEIEEAERELEVLFPKSYKWFLEKLGAADTPFDIYGLGTVCVTGENYPIWNVVFMTKTERERVEPPLPKHLVAISPDGTGNHWCLNTYDREVLDCPVIIWNHDAGTDQELEQTNPGFIDWLEDLATSLETNYL